MGGVFENPPPTQKVGPVSSIVVLTSSLMTVMICFIACGTSWDCKGGHSWEKQKMWDFWDGMVILIIQLSCTVRIPIFWLVDLYHMTLGCDKTTTLMSLSWFNNRGVNSTHHCHYSIASLTQSLTIFVCSVFNLNNKNVNTLIARVLKFLVHC